MKLKPVTHFSTSLLDTVIGSLLRRQLLTL